MMISLLFHRYPSVPCQGCTMTNFRCLPAERDTTQHNHHNFYIYTHSHNHTPRHRYLYLNTPAHRYAHAHSASCTLPAYALSTTWLMLRCIFIGMAGNDAVKKHSSADNTCRYQSIIRLWPFSQSQCKPMQQSTQHNTLIKSKHKCCHHLHPHHLLSHYITTHSPHITCINDSLCLALLCPDDESPYGNLFDGEV